MCFPELLLFALPASSAVVSEKFFNFFRNFDPPFPEKNGEGKVWQARGRFAKGGIMKITPRSRDSHLRLGFPFANGLLLGSRSN
jgi:hypothetical protein